MMRDFLGAKGEGIPVSVDGARGGNPSRLSQDGRSRFPAPYPLPGNFLLETSILSRPELSGMGILVQIGAADSRPGGVAAGSVGVRGAVFLLAARGRAWRSCAFGALRSDRLCGGEAGHVLGASPFGWGLGAFFIADAFVARSLKVNLSQQVQPGFFMGVGFVGR